MTPREIEIAMATMDKDLLRRAQKNVAAATRRRIVTGMSWTYLGSAPIFWVIGIAAHGKNDVDLANCWAGCAILSLGPYLAYTTVRAVVGDSATLPFHYWCVTGPLSALITVPDRMASWASAEITLRVARIVGINVLIGCILVAVLRSIRLAWTWSHPEPIPTLWDADADLPLAPKGAP